MALQPSQKGLTPKLQKAWEGPYVVLKRIWSIEYNWLPAPNPRLCMWIASGSTDLALLKLFNDLQTTLSEVPPTQFSIATTAETVSPRIHTPAPPGDTWTNARAADQSDTESGESNGEDQNGLRQSACHRLPPERHGQTC